MKIICLKPHPHQYSCSSYLILGDWNRIADVNTLIDSGIDNFVLEEIKGLSTGVGKRAVEQIVLTHNHFDHCAGTKFIKEKYSCPVLAFSQQGQVDRSLQDGEIIVCGDREFEVIHVPGHSSDSICLYCATEKVLFSGDTPLFVQSPGGSYSESYMNALEKIVRRNIVIVYPGHGEPISGNIQERLITTLRHVQQSHISKG